MARIVYFLFFLSLYTSPCLAQNKTGLSYLGICHADWPCDESIKAYEGQTHLNLSFLYDRTFGDDCSCIRKFYQDPRNKLSRIHLSNGPGLRNRRLQAEEIFYGYELDTAQNAILRDVPELKQKFQNVAERAANDYTQSAGQNELFVSTCLECNFSAEARARLIDWAKPYFPHASFVDNPINGPCLEGYICERHGSSAFISPPCFADLDGEDAAKVDIKTFKADYQGCLANFLWGTKLNLNELREKKFTAPRKRSVIPDQDYFRKFTALLSR